MNAQKMKKNDLPAGFAEAADAYLLLEQEVRRLTAGMCFPFCSRCSGACCKEDICRESIESFWLSSIWPMRNHHIARYHPQRGWLASKGCMISAGRPPVCYDFLCDRMLESLPAGPQLACLKEVSRLPGRAGERALGNRHLVALSPEQVLTRLNLQRLRARIEGALNCCGQWEEKLKSP